MVALPGLPAAACAGRRCQLKRVQASSTLLSTPVSPIKQGTARQRPGSCSKRPPYHWWGNPNRGASAPRCRGNCSVRGPICLPKDLCVRNAGLGPCLPCPVAVLAPLPPYLALRRDAELRLSQTWCLTKNGSDGCRVITWRHLRQGPPSRARSACCSHVGPPHEQWQLAAQ